jgi:hypothetical protein
LAFGLGSFVGSHGGVACVIKGLQSLRFYRLTAGLVGWRPHRQLALAKIGSMLLVLTVSGFGSA